jgi:hypothetical protein
VPAAVPVSSLPTPADFDPRTVPLHLEISRQAHALWEKYGRPSGRDVAIWLEAEQQVLGTDARVRRQAGGAVSAASLTDTLYPKHPPPGMGSEAAARSAGNNVRQ